MNRKELLAHGGRECEWGKNPSDPYLGGVRREPAIHISFRVLRVIRRRRDFFALRLSQIDAQLEEGADYSLLVERDVVIAVVVVGVEVVGYIPNSSTIANGGFFPRIVQQRVEPFLVRVKPKRSS